MADDTSTNGYSTLGFGVNNVPSQLMDMLACDGIVPGSPPSYQLCKEIYTYHPLGMKMAESPIRMAQSQKREIQIPGSPEKELKEAFEKEWRKIGADQVIRSTFALSRVYGISSLVMGGDEQDTGKPVNLDKIGSAELFFNVVDPLTTAGSLILNQDPNASDYLKPSAIRVANQEYHPSRAVVIMNEQPVYIEWTNSAFGFVGRSVYQRALYPLKSYVQSMITDNLITEKSGLIVAKLKAPGSIIDQLARGFMGLKRSAIKGARTGNVLTVGIDESVESLQLMHMRDAAEFARNNILKNIATAADMPASLINQETLAEGFGEGSEDAKNIARYIDGVRIEVQPLYTFFDNIVQRRAWSPDFYAALQKKYPSVYGGVSYETAFYEWKNAFIAEWQNLLQEPESEKAKKDDIILKAAIGVFEVLAPVLDPENKATAAAWLANVVNERRRMFSSSLDLDEELIAEFTPPLTNALDHEPENMPESKRD